MLSRRWTCKPKQSESWSPSRNQRCAHLMRNSFKNTAETHQGCQSGWKLHDSYSDVSQKMNIWWVAAFLFQAEGYTDGDLTLFHSFTVTAFLKAENPVDFLAKASEVRSLHRGTLSLTKSDWTFLSKSASQTSGLSRFFWTDLCFVLFRSSWTTKTWSLMQQLQMK